MIARAGKECCIGLGDSSVDRADQEYDEHERPPVPVIDVREECVRRERPSIGEFVSQLSAAPCKLAEEFRAEL